VRPMARPARVRPPGSFPAFVSAFIAFLTAVGYLVVIVSQGDVDAPAAALVAGWIVGLGMCALLGGLRLGPERVIALGAATGGLFGAAVLALFSIGALLLVAAISALVAWIRAGAEVPARQNQLGALAGIGAALGFLAIVFLI